MRIAQITRLFCPCRAEKPEESDIHENSRKLQHLVEIRRHIPSRRAQADGTPISKSPVDSHDSKGKKTLTIAGPMRKSFQCEYSSRYRKSPSEGTIRFSPS